MVESQAKEINYLFMFLSYNFWTNWELDLSRLVSRTITYIYNTNIQIQTPTHMHVYVNVRLYARNKWVEAAAA